MDGSGNFSEAELLALQLSEVEMLTSMFPNQGEMVLDDPFVIELFQRFVDAEITYENLTARLGFTLKLKADDKDLEIVCHLPHEYPAVPPDIFTRASSLSKAQHKQFNEDLQKFILELDRGDLYMCSITQWIQDNYMTYQKASQTDCPQHAATKKDPSKQNKQDSFSRMWIYSHHIYSKIKRKSILEFSSEMKLSGFCLPGKPGVVCIEGYSDDVAEFWHRVRGMNWKRIVMKEREDQHIADGNIDALRKFSGFEEKNFDAHGGRHNHMNMGKLLKFLEEHDCAHIFNLYFGVEGKIPD